MNMESAESTSNRALILAPIGRDATASADLLERVGLRSLICRDLSELMDGLGGDPVSVLVDEEALFGKDTSALVTWVANQPTWSDLPFIVLTSKVGHPRVATW